jgi:protein gp37
VQWQAKAAEFMAQHGRRQRVFCASLADVFDNQVPVQWRADLLQLIDLTPDLDWLLLTKRIGNVVPMLSEIARAAGGVRAIDLWPRPNVWLGATITSQAEADRDIPKLLAVPARVRFLSMEPLLGPVDLTSIRQHLDGESYIEGNVLVRKSTLDRGADRPGVDWVIVGGESGPGARPMHPDWARSLRDQCAEVGVPFLFKQWGEWIPASQSAAARAANGYAPIQELEHLDGHRMHRIGKKAAGRLLDDVEHNGFPFVDLDMKTA